MTALMEARLDERFQEGVLPFLAHLSLATSEDDLLSRLALEIQQQMHCDACDILLVERGNGLTLRASTSSPEFVGRCRLGKGIGLCGLVAATGETMFFSKSIEEHVSYVRYPGLDNVAYESGFVTPLIIGKGIAGVLMVRRTERWRSTKATVKRLRALVQAVGLSIQAFRRDLRPSDRLGALSEVTKTIANSPYLEEILQLLVNITAQQFRYRVCTVRLLDEANEELILRATQATVKAYQRKRAIKLGESIAGKALEMNQTFIVRDVQEEEDYIGHDLAVEQGLRSMICVPLSIQGRPIGVMTCYADEVRDFLPDEIAALETIAKQAAVSIENAKLQVRHTLMQEMHHRVKNNLQQVASLLRLQLRHSHYKSIEEALNDSLSRILAIAAVHDLLSREDLDHVGLRSIAEALVNHQQQSLMLPGKQIGFLVRGDDVRLNMNQATQVALVLNELIQNAVMHGFEVCDEGDIHITIEQKEEQIGLWVSNNGDVLPEGFDPAVASHLGLNIVENLSRSLGGRFVIGDILGWTVAEVKFSRASSE